jgi:hypothetical protein
MYYAVKSVQPLDNYYLRLQFEAGEVKFFDCKPYLDIGRFSELKDIGLFDSVKVSFDTIEWSNGLDLDPELLYKKARETRV